MVFRCLHCNSVPIHDHVYWLSQQTWASHETSCTTILRLQRQKFCLQACYSGIILCDSTCRWQHGQNSTFGPTGVCFTMGKWVLLFAFRHIRDHLLWKGRVLMQTLQMSRMARVLWNSRGTGKIQLQSNSQIRNHFPHCLLGSLPGRRVGRCHWCVGQEAKAGKEMNVNLHTVSQFLNPSTHPSDFHPRKNEAEFKGTFQPGRNTQAKQNQWRIWLGGRTVAWGSFQGPCIKAWRATFSPAQLYRSHVVWI